MHIYEVQMEEKRMKNIIIALVLLIFFVSPVFARADHDHKDDQGERHISISSLKEWHINDVDFEIDDGSIYISHDDPLYESVEINEKYELFVNDEKVELDAEQQELVTAYYDLTMSIVYRAKDIGWEGVKIGLAGAHLALKAVGGVVKMVLTSYDEDDFENYMDQEAEKLEDRAEVLEKKAEDIEKWAEDLDLVAEQMNEMIPEVEKLGWFYQ